MPQTFFTNQFAQGNVVGSLDLVTNPNPGVFTCRYYHATTTQTPGEGVILTDRGANDSAGAPIVTKRAADGDTIHGVCVFDPKSAEKSSGDRISVASAGSVVWFESSAAVLRGADVALVLASAGQVVTRTTETILGVALDKAAGAGDLIRVRLA